MGTYEPPLSLSGTPFNLAREQPIAPGVLGYAIEEKGRIFIPLIIAEHEGDGAVGRFLDSLSSRCVIPTVTSGRLAGMLKRRGWKRWVEFDEEIHEDVEIWKR